jgi:N-acetyl-gamma-glutamyl-phosphate reductase
MIAGIIGATGYAGAELVRILSGHPKIEKLLLSSVSFEGAQIEEVYPNFLRRISAPLLKAEEVIAGADIVFLSLPSGVGEPFAAACLERGVSCIDISADFRFGDDEAVFCAWYGKPYAHQEPHKRSVYGLPELNRGRIRELAALGPLVIGNPGCYPTSASLGAFPALAKGLFAANGAPVIVDSVSGISGGGREPSRSFHYPECSDSVSPYKTGAHRHTPEIARAFAAMTGSGRAAPAVIFTPHLAPMNRGILSTIYIPLAPQWQAEQSGASGVTGGAVMPPSAAVEKKAEEIRGLYAGFYQDEAFVRILPRGLSAATNRVRQSNFCDISVHLDQSGSTLIIASAIDNMVKGAAGQAVQNMNIIFGFDERTALEMVPALF